MKEVEEDKIGTIYFVFDDIQLNPGPGHEEDTMECFIDCCCKYLYGLYCIEQSSTIFKKTIILYKKEL